MKVRALEIIGAISALGVIGGLVWIGSLENRVSQLEKQADELRMGPRGQNCQQIVGRLVEQPENAHLKALALEWGCADMPAVHVDEGAQQSGPATKLCADGSVVLAVDQCETPPPPPPPPEPEPER